MSKLDVFQSEQKKRQFLNRLQGELVKRGIVDVLRNGIKMYPKDQLTKQNVDDAVQQYKDDRDPREMLFQFKRCMVHLAVDDARIKFCTRLAGKDSWFLPFDKGYNDGAGDPLDPNIFLNLLIPKLPSPREDDLSQGILEAIDLESYRNEARESISIKLEDPDPEIAPVPSGKVGHIIEPEMDLLSVILSDFNDMFGNINWNDADNVRRQILEIPAMVSRDEKYQNAMKNSDEQSARLESERALQQIIFAIMADNMELFKQFQDNPSFKKWLSDLVFHLTYNKEGKPYEASPQGHKSVVYNFESQQELQMVAEEQSPYGEKNE